MSKTTKNKSGRSNAFHATRASHLLESAEDYTELVADLIHEKGEARTVEIARQLGISHVTALRTIKRLQREGYLITYPHKPVELTEKGAKLATFCKKRHQVILDFLIAIGVPKRFAEIDAEGVEHHISKHTLQAMKKHLNRK